MRASIAAVLAALWLLAGAGARAADDDGAQQVFEQARRAATAGPAEITLAGQARLRLPAGTSFVPQPHAARVLNAMGNPGRDERLQGLVFPQRDGGWFVTVRYIDAGYIKDDDAKDWKADDLLANIREGTAAANDERRRIGVPELDVLGWAEKPAYDAATHRLAWALSSREKGAPADAPQGVNYNTFALGREGYFSLNLVTALADLPVHKGDAQGLLDGLAFDEGKRYADFNASTDHMAEYGLAALVAGVAAKKIGLIALAGAFFAKFFKLVVVGLALLGGAATRLFRRKGKAAP